MTDIRPIKLLTCSCCGAATKGAQWHNRDTGYGLCNDCIPRCKLGQTAFSFERNYGTDGVHYNIQNERAA